MTGSGTLSRRAATTAGSAALFGAVFALLLINERDGALLLFFAVPIALLALEFGLTGGIAGGVVAAGLFGLDVLIEGTRFEPAGWLARPAAFLLLGAVVGALADRGRREAQARARLARERGELVARILRAEDEERHRIAQELHDHALQSLLAANQELIEASPGRAGVAKAQHVVRGAIERLRHVVLALHPVTLEHGGLDAALVALAREAGRRGGFHPAVRVDPGAAEAAGQEELIVSVARELLNNAARHSGATEVSVSLTRAGEAITLEVADDGHGIPPGRRETAVRDGHIGLASIDQRLGAIGGKFELIAGPGEGTRARARIPEAPRLPLSS